MPQDRSGAGAGPGPGSTLKLLVIDDDAVQRAIICKIGAQVGYEPVGAASYAEALAQLTAGTFDCLTLDLSLGEHDGVEVLRAIEGAHREVPVIIISGCHESVLNSTMRIGQSLRLNMHGPIPKPVNLGVLRQFLALVKSERTAAAKPPPASITVEDFVRAANSGEITVEYRPRCELSTGVLVGCEAAAAWNSPRFGVVPAAALHALAEKAQLTARLAEEVLQSALAGTAPVIGTVPGFSLLVRLPQVVLADAAGPDRVERALHAAGVPPQALIVAVAEKVAMAHVRRITDAFVRLRIKGVRGALAEFGGGPISLPALACMPLCELELDARFVADYDADADVRRIAGAAIALARQFDMAPAAAGITDARTWYRLAEAGCTIGQGAVLAPPLDRAALPAFVADWHKRAAVTPRAG